MKKVFVLCGWYGDEDCTCFGVFSSYSTCERQCLRLRKRFARTLWKFYFHSFKVDDCSLIDNYIDFCRAI